MKILRFAHLVSLAAAGAVAQDTTVAPFATATPVGGASAATTPTAPRPYRAQVIGQGDLIGIQVFHIDEISKSWRVGETGKLQLPMVGEMQCAGLTVDAFERALTVRLKKFIQEPQASVQIIEYKSQPVTVTGSVNQPGTIQLQGERSLFEVMVMVGGPKDMSGFMTISRPVDRGELMLPEARQTADGKFRTARIKVADVMNGRSVPAVLKVTPDDVINVEARIVQMVHVLGEVNKPGSVELVEVETVSITKLIAVAGGMTSLALPKKAMVRRIGEDGARAEVVTIDLGKIMSGHAADIELSTGHVLFIPNNKLKTVVATASQAAISAGVYSGMRVIGRF